MITYGSNELISSIDLEQRLDSYLVSDKSNSFKLVRFPISFGNSVSWLPAKPNLLKLVSLKKYGVNWIKFCLSDMNHLSLILISYVTFKGFTWKFTYLI